MLNGLFALLAALKNFVEDILAKVPLSASTLASVAAALISYFGYHVSAAQLTAIVVAVVAVVNLVIHHSATASALREAKAGK